MSEREVDLSQLSVQQLQSLRQQFEEVRIMSPLEHSRLITDICEIGSVHVFQFT